MITARMRLALIAALKDPDVVIERVRGDEEMLSVRGNGQAISLVVPGIYDPGDEWIAERKRLKAS